MRGFNIKNSWRAVFVLSLFFVTALLITTAPPTSAGVNDQVDHRVCNLPVKNLEPTDGSGSYWVDVQFVNRATIKVTLKSDTFFCTNINPQQSIKYLDGSKELSEYVEGTYTDKKTTDANWEYTGGSQYSHIQQFNNSANGNFNDGDDPHIDTFSDAQLSEFMKNIELKIRADEKNVNNACEADGSTFGTGDLDMFFDAKKGNWQCRLTSDNGVAYDFTGVRIFRALSNTDNFNITFNYDGTSILPVDTNNNDEWSFNICPNAKGARGSLFGSRGCGSNAHFMELTADEMKSLGSDQVRHNLAIYNSIADADAAKNAKHSVTIAGTKTASAVAAPTNGGGDGGKATPSCESSGVSLAWIFCPVIDGIANTIDGIYSAFIKPLLVTDPIDISPNAKCDVASKYKGCDYAIWSNFRIFGDIFLVIALLVIVFGQSIGGGLIDAYTAKKVLPRLVISAILINLSIYIVALAVDLTNILGNGIQTLLTAPFSNADAFHLTLSKTSQGLGVAGILGATGTIWASVAIASSVGSAAVLSFAAVAIPKIVMFFAVFILLPAVLLFLAILATVLIRRGAIIFLILASPVAFALYCLPNTEKYFKKWWDLLFRALLVYPIIATIFTIADILAVTIQQGSSGGIQWVADLLAVVALILPLFLIPFSFRLAGGIIGKLSDVSTGLSKRSGEAIKGNPNNMNSLRNRTKGNMSDVFTRAGAQTYRSLKKSDRVSNSKFLSGAAGFAFAGSNEKEAGLVKAAKEKVANSKDWGDDSILNARASYTRKDADGVTRRYTLDNKPVNNADWVASQRLLPGLAGIQAVADYRSTKVASTEEAEAFERNYGMMSQQQGMTLDEANGAFTGLSFARQNERGEWKHGHWAEEPAKDANGNLETDANGKLTNRKERVFKRVGKDNMKGAKGMIHEQYYKKGSFDASRAFSSQFQALGEIKQAHIDTMRQADAEEASAKALIANGDQGAAALVSTAQAKRNEAREELRKTIEIEQAWDQKAMGKDADGNKIEGLSGASAGTKAAFDDFKTVGSTSDAAGNRTDVAEVAAIKAELAQGKTWESLNNQKRQGP